MHCYGVTGTNGKTTVVHMMMQFWDGMRYAGLGTMMLTGSRDLKDVKELTTMVGEYYVHYANNFRNIMRKLQARNAQNFIFEAWHDRLYMYENLYYHGAAFTNLYADHLDHYNGDMEAYFQKKLTFMRDLVPKKAYKVIYADCPYGRRVMEAVQNIITYGASPDYDLYYDDTHIYFPSKVPRDAREYDGRERMHFPIANLTFSSTYMVQNLLCAIGLALISGVSGNVILKKLPTLTIPFGRKSKLASSDNIKVYYDYTKNPIGLELVLKELSAETHNRIIIALGLEWGTCSMIRPAMIEIASHYGDTVIVTNNWHPEPIKEEMRRICPHMIEIENAHEARQHALSCASDGDIVLLGMV